MFDFFDVNLICTKETSNDIVAGNGRVFSAYIVTVRKKRLNKNILVKSFFFFFIRLLRVCRDMLCVHIIS